MIPDIHFTVPPSLSFVLVNTTHARIIVDVHSVRSVYFILSNLYLFVMIIIVNIPWVSLIIVSSELIQYIFARIIF